MISSEAGQAFANNYWWLSNILNSCNLCLVKNRSSVLCCSM